MAVLIGLRLYLKKPALYVGYTMWLFFLTPLVRRLVDWQLGYEEPNYVLLAPLLVSGFGVIALIAPSQEQKRQLPPAIYLCLAAVVYGFLNGMFLEPGLEGVFGLVNWLTPLLFGSYIAIDWRNYAANRQVMLRSFVWGAGVMGTYGIYQFFVAPAWDAFWLTNVTATLTDPSFGQPEPMLMRIWSTLNGPGPFAGTIATCLLFLIIARSKYKVPIAIAGFTALLLSSVRAVWLGYLFSLFLLLRKMNPKALARTFFSIVVLVVLMIPILSKLSVYAPGIADRVATLTDGKSDESLQERQSMYAEEAGVLLKEPFGMGLANRTVVGRYPLDSGIVATLLALGWLGTAAYLIGMFWLLFSTGRAKNKDLFHLAARAICWSAVVQYTGANIFTGLGGAFYWLCLASCYASVRWEAEQRSPALAAGLPETSLDRQPVTTPLVEVAGT